MVNYYRGQFFFPFALNQGTFSKVLNSERSEEDSAGMHFRRTPDITHHNPKTFAEYQYFHPHTRELLFSATPAGHRSLLFYEVFNRQIVDNKTIDSQLNDLEIEVAWVQKQGESEVFRTVVLQVEWVAACLYDMDVGCVVLGVKHDPTSGATVQRLSFDDVLDLNNLIRRSAPSFLDNKDVEKSSVNPGKFKGWASKQKENVELPLRVSLSHRGVLIDEETFGDAFDDFVTGGKGRSHEPYVAAHLRYFVDLFLSEVVDQDRSECQKGENIRLPGWQPILDERNFVCSLVVTDGDDTGFGKPDVCYRCGLPNENRYGILTNESDGFRNRLYQYVFVDPSHSNYTANREFRDTCLQDSLYLRFRDWGSYYGFTRYSGTYLIHGAFNDTARMISGHFNSMYFQMASLALCHRAVLLELSRRAAEIARVVDSSVSLENSDVQEDLADLRADFLRFHNKYWYSEITGQEQGYEMFTLWSRNMGNDRMFSEVEKEIAAIHDFANATVGSRLGSLAYLNLSMTMVGLLALVVSALGVSFLTDRNYEVHFVGIGLGVFLTGIGFAVGALLFGKRFLDCLPEIVGRLDRRSRTRSMGSVSPR